MMIGVSLSSEVASSEKRNCQIAAEVISTAGRLFHRADCGDTSPALVAIDL
jgi:hypothetical protein